MTRTIVPRVSDHAMLRYFERVYELDIESAARRNPDAGDRAKIAAGAVTVTIRGHRRRFTTAASRRFCRRKVS
ncbi:MAG: hypothetical protein IPK23_14985 [Rhizobiales bacterium]|nr:hypothetical protein [Hyphomicrobiales bacterium]